MNQNFSSIAFEIPEGFWPAHYEIEGRLLRIYLTNKNPLHWEIVEPYRKDKYLS
jgi:hypothetical protein